MIGAVVENEHVVGSGLHSHPNEDFAWPEWSPDGRSILLTRDESVVAVQLDAMIEAVVTQGCCASIAPDGRRLIVGRGS